MFTAAAILGGATLAATGASIASKRRQERRQLQYLREQRDYNEPINQKNRFLAAGINPLAQDYQNVDNQQFNASDYDIGSDIQNGVNGVANIAANAYSQFQQSKLIDAQVANADARTNVQNETLISQQTQNKFLESYLKGRNQSQDLQNKLNELLLSEHPEEHQAQIDLLKEQIQNAKNDNFTKEEFLKVYPQMLQNELALQKSQIIDFEEVSKLRAPQLVLAQYDKQLYSTEGYKQMYKYLQRSGLDYQAKQMFLALEAYSMDYALLQEQKKLQPHTLELLRNQVNATLAQSKIDLDTISQRSKVSGFDAWYDWTMSKVGGLVSLGLNVGKLGALRGVVNPSYAHPNYHDTITHTDRFGEITGHTMRSRSFDISR